MELDWEYASNDPVARVGNMIFRLHEQYLKSESNYNNDTHIFTLQVRKKDTIAFKDLGYTFYIGNKKYKHNKSVNGDLWDDMADIIYATENILSVLGFLDGR